MTFEESLKSLETMSERITREDITLEEAIRCYEEGIKCYEECNRLLNSARQKIETYEEGAE